MCIRDSSVGLPVQFDMVEHDEESVLSQKDDHTVQTLDVNSSNNWAIGLSSMYV